MNAERPILPVEERMSPDRLSSEGNQRKLVHTKIKNIIAVGAPGSVHRPQWTYAEACKAPQVLLTPVVALVM